MKNFLFFLFITISNCCLSQAFRISDNPKLKKVDVFIAPGISPEGQRLLQFSFIKMSKFRNEIKTDKISLITDEGIEVMLLNPIKDTSYQDNTHSKNWYARFALSEENIATLRQYRITFIQIMDGKKLRRLPVSSVASIEMNSLIASKF